MKLHRAVLAICVACSASALAQVPSPTPPMGWNSWDSYGTTVTEAQVKANADAMARDLKSHGWQYIVVDIQWYEPNAQGHDYAPGAKLAMDEYGRLLPAVNRFPSSANGQGFKSLADYVHSKGLKFGIHIVRGIPRQAVEQNLPIKGTPLHAADVADKDNHCRWNPDMWGVDTTKPGAQAYYDSIAELYASWGVDFIKADDMGSHLYQPAEIRALALAIRKTGRAMVLSISPGPAPISEAEFFEKYAQMWRISDDFWDDWKLLKKQFDYIRDWAGLLSRVELARDLQRTPGAVHRRLYDLGLHTYQRWGWTLHRVERVAQIPRHRLQKYIDRGDLPSLDPATMGLITNDEVLAVDQHSSGNRQVLEEGNLRAWIADVPNSKDRYIAVFNLGDEVANIELPWSKVGINAFILHVRDLWTKTSLGEKDRLLVTLRPHATALYRISP